GAEVVEPLDAVRVLPEVQIEMSDRAGIIAEDYVRVPHVVMDFHVVGSERLHALEFFDGQLQVSLIPQDHTEVATTDRAVRVGLEGISPQVLGVSPDLDLLSAQVGETADP